MRTNNRWVIAIAGVFFQIALGAVYAWSVFRVPLTKQFGWSISEVTLTFTISIFVLGFAAFFGGLWLNRKGPRIVALTGGVFYGVGVFLASFTHSLAWLYISYGLIGGIGLGLGYIVPVAVLVKWFPDKRGLITGIAVGGFGAGRAHHRAGGDATHSKRWCLEDIRLPRHRLSHRHNHCRHVLAKSAGRLAIGRLETKRAANFATRWTRLRAGRSVENMAVVGALDASFS
jgi:hypothetical protein